MRISFSKNGVPVRITEERFDHISRNHPELKNRLNELAETINDPDIVQKGDAGDLLAIKKFAHTPVKDNKYLVAVYKELTAQDGFVLTAYYTSILRRRMVLWKH